jgi:drug/metabolite transporter (DMT)-like permease
LGSSSDQTRIDVEIPINDGKALSDSERIAKLRRRSGIGLVVIAALLWSTSGFFARAPWFDDWPLQWRGLTLAFYRAIFATLLLLPFIRRVSFRWEMIPMVLFFSVMNWTYLTALVQGPPTNAIWLQNTAPVWVLLVGVIWMREPLHRGDIWMTIGCLSGVAVILISELIKQAPVVPTLLGLFSGLLYAGVVLSLMRMRTEDPAYLIALNHIVTALSLLPVAWASGISPTPFQWCALAAFGSLQMGLPYLLFTKGIRNTSGHEATLIALLEPVLLPVWIFVAWRNSPDYEPPSFWTILGATLIMLGLLARYGVRFRPSTLTLAAENETINKSH